jgi:hypothetical protein
MLDVAQMVAKWVLRETQAEHRAVDELRVRVSAATLARSVAERHGLTHDQVIDGCDRVPDNLLPLLDTPEGWSVLSDLVASAAGTQPRPLRVTLQ